jgi:membrane-bound inhibitor of C-type lysozyme
VGRELQVRRAPDGSAATITLEGRDVSLQRTASAAQEKYVGGAWALYIEPEGAMLESQGSVVRAYCRPTTPIPVAPRLNY